MEVCYKGSIRINKTVVEKQKVHWELKSSIDDPQWVCLGLFVIVIATFLAQYLLSKSLYGYTSIIYFGLKKYWYLKKSIRRIWNEL